MLTRKRRFKNMIGGRVAYWDRTVDGTPGVPYRARVTGLMLTGDSCPQLLLTLHDPRSGRKGLARVPVDSPKLYDNWKSMCIAIRHTLESEYWGLDGIEVLARFHRYRSQLEVMLKDMDARVDCELLRMMSMPTCRKLEAVLARTVSSLRPLYDLVVDTSMERKALRDRGVLEGGRDGDEG